MEYVSWNLIGKRLLKQMVCIVFFLLIESFHNLFSNILFSLILLLLSLIDYGLNQRIDSNIEH